MTASLRQNPDLLDRLGDGGPVRGEAAGRRATCFLIWTGIREMRRQTDREARQNREAHETEFCRHKHEEAMAALKALIERTATPAVKGTS